MNVRNKSALGIHVAAASHAASHGCHAPEACMKKRTDRKIMDLPPYILLGIYESYVRAVPFDYGGAIWCPKEAPPACAKPLRRRQVRWRSYKKINTKFFLSAPCGV
jgi:hypothetical protein